MARFDEIELRGTGADDSEPVPSDVPRTDRASLGRRLVAFTIDLSLFIAAGIAMSPIIPEQGNPFAARAAVVGFLVLVSLYYLGLAWMVWGKTIGGAIADVRVVSDERADVNVAQAAKRWLGTILSIATLGAGFLPALFGEHRNLADRLSRTRVVSRV